MRDSTMNTYTYIDTGQPDRGQRGITGLETAIILIAFVVVASVFAFTILSSGVFAAERSKQSIRAGLQDTRSTLLPKGSTRAFRGFDAANAPVVFKISFTVANAVGGEPVDLTPPYTADEAGTDPDLVSGAEYVTVLSYTDETQYLSDVPWTVNFVGANNGDNLLEVGEAAEITIFGTGLNGPVKLGPDVTVQEISSDSNRVVVRAKAGDQAKPARTQVSVGHNNAMGLFTVYRTVDSVKVEPGFAISRVGGGTTPAVNAQFEAVAYANGAYGDAGTDDDIKNWRET